MISKRFEFEKIPLVRKKYYYTYYYKYFKCYYLFKLLIYKKQIDFTEFLENGGYLC